MKGLPITETIQNIFERLQLQNENCVTDDDRYLELMSKLHNRESKSIVDFSP